MMKKTIELKSTWRQSSLQEMEEQKKFWDLRAQEFDAIVDKQEDTNQLMEYLKNKGIINEPCNIIDIGCGAGKYQIEFSQMGHAVTGIDLSPKMIEYAKKRSDEKGYANVKFHERSWQALDIDTMGFRKKFDLAFSSMSPAVSSVETVIKMNEVSKKNCFMSGFVYRKDELRDGIRGCLDMAAPNNREQKSIYYAFNALWQMGIYPELTYHDVVWEKYHTLDKAVEIYSMMFTESTFSKEEKVERIRTFLKKREVEGKVYEKTHAKIAWMSWQV